MKPLVKIETFNKREINTKVDLIHDEVCPVLKELKVKYWVHTIESIDMESLLLNVGQKQGFFLTFLVASAHKKVKMYNPYIKMPETLKNRPKNTKIKVIRELFKHKNLNYLIMQQNLNGNLLFSVGSFLTIPIHFWEFSRKGNLYFPKYEKTFVPLSEVKSKIKKQLI